MLKGPEVCQAFEVEQITTRKKNYTFIWEPERKAIEVYDTSRGVGKRFFDKDDTPIAWERFSNIYKESLRSFDAPFLGFVDPDTIELLEE